MSQELTLSGFQHPMAVSSSRNLLRLLWLPRYKQAEPRLQPYLATLKDYRKNSYDSDPQASEQVNRHWAFAFEHWKYEMQHVESVSA